MEFDAPGPWGLSSSYFALLVVPLCLIMTVVLVVVRRRDISVRLGAIVTASLLAASWALFTIGDSVRVPIPEDPEGAVCIKSDYGAPIQWGSECGRAFARHLMVSVGPALLMLVVSTGAVASSIRRREDTPVESQPSL